MRYLLLLALGVPALCQSPIVKILSDELDRNFAALKQKADPPPYFIGYEVTDEETDIVLASSGSLDAQSHSRHRVLDVTVRVGTPQLDNYHRAVEDRIRFTSAVPLALDDNPTSIRHAVWLATDRVYRAASNRLIRIKADEKLLAGASDKSADFSAEPTRQLRA